MRILVCGSRGCIGSAVVQALRSRGHDVVEGARGAAESSRAMAIDFMAPVTPAAWARRLGGRHVDAVVNCVGILQPSGAQRFERIHTAGPIELFEGAARAGVRHIVQISALGVGRDSACLATPYLRSKLLADERLAALPVAWSVLRPSLVYGPRSQSARMFATLASLPVIGLPGAGTQRLQPVHVYEVAEMVTRLLEGRAAANAVDEIGGGDVVDYRRMLAAYREALKLGEAIWLPVPSFAMTIGAWLAESLPQQVFTRETLRLLDRGSVPAVNAATRLLGREPTALAQGLGFGTPEPALDLRVTMAAPVDLALRAALAFMWIYTALISIAWQRESGVMQLLARCGFEGSAGTVALAASCTLNIGLGLLTLLRPTPWLFLAQAGAIVGYTLTAAIHMPELTIDHCGPLVKNLPVLVALGVLWLGHASTPRRMQAAKTERRDSPARGKTDNQRPVARTLA